MTLTDFVKQILDSEISLLGTILKIKVINPKIAYREIPYQSSINIIVNYYQIVDQSVHILSEGRKFQFYYNFGKNRKTEGLFSDGNIFCSIVEVICNGVEYKAE